MYAGEGFRIRSAYATEKWSQDGQNEGMRWPVDGTNVIGTRPAADDEIVRLLRAIDHSSAIRVVTSI